MLKAVFNFAHTTFAPYGWFMQIWSRTLLRAMSANGTNESATPACVRVPSESTFEMIGFHNGNQTLIMTFIWHHLEHVPLLWSLPHVLQITHNLSVKRSSPIHFGGRDSWLSHCLWDSVCVSCELSTVSEPRCRDTDSSRIRSSAF